MAETDRDPHEPKPEDEWEVLDWLGYLLVQPWVWIVSLGCLAFLVIADTVSMHTLIWGTVWLIVAVAVIGFFVVAWAVEDRGAHPDGTPKQTPMRQFWNWREARRLETLTRKDIADDHDRTKELIELEHKNAMAESRAQIDSVEYLEEIRHDYGFRELRYTKKVDLKRQKRELERDYYKIDQDFRIRSKEINTGLVKDVLDLVSDLIKWYSARRGKSVADRIQELQDIQDQVRRMQATGNYTAQDIRRILDALMTDFARSKP